MAISWEMDCVELLRNLINDVAEPQRYTDDRLTRALVVAAFQVLRRADFSQDFIVDISQQLITPDPTDRDGGTNDEDFVNFMCLKAACIIDTGAAMLAAQSAFTAKDMVTQVDLRGVATSTLAILEKGYCSTFETLLGEYIDGNNFVSAAVMGPFRLNARNFNNAALIPPYRIF
jgi:hypothetical protein